MDVVIQLIRHIEVDDQLDVFDIDSASRDVRSDQNSGIAISECFHCVASLGKGPVGVNLDTGVAHPADGLGDLSGTMASADKDQDGTTALIKQGLEYGSAILLWHEDHLLRYQFRGGANRVDFDADGISLSGVCQVSNFGWHGCAEKERLSVLRCARKQQFDGWGKAHVKHAISFVQNDDVHAVQSQGALVEVILEPSGCTDDDFRLSSQHADLPIHGSASDDQGAAQMKFS
jgi:hypothetical protein